MGDRVRITAKLMDPMTERPLWTGNYEQEMKDILVLQSEISQPIVREIRLKLTPQEQSRLASGQQADPTAYEYYSKARQIQVNLSIDPSRLSLQKDKPRSMSQICHRLCLNAPNPD